MTPNEPNETERHEDDIQPNEQPAEPENHEEGTDETVTENG
jgi:hypothetical protein